MKNIKFKAFYKRYKSIEDVVAIDFDEELVTLRLIDEHDMDTEDRMVGFDEVELLQWTKLFDRNGLKIYKKNIVKVYNKKSRFYNDVAKVVFQNGCFMLKSIDLEDEYVEFFTSNAYSLYNPEDYEVVGNCYEEYYNES